MWSIDKEMLRKCNAIITDFLVMIIGNGYKVAKFEIDMTILTCFKQLFNVKNVCKNVKNKHILNWTYGLFGVIILETNWHLCNILWFTTSGCCRSCLQIFFRFCIMLYYKNIKLLN